MSYLKCDENDEVFIFPQYNKKSPKGKKHPYCMELDQLATSILEELRLYASCTAKQLSAALHVPKSDVNSRLYGLERLQRVLRTKQDNSQAPLWSPADRIRTAVDDVMALANTRQATVEVRSEQHQNVQGLSYFGKATWTSNAVTMTVAAQQLAESPEQAKILSAQALLQRLASSDVQVKAIADMEKQRKLLLYVGAVWPLEESGSCELKGPETEHEAWQLDKFRKSFSCFALRTVVAFWNAPSDKTSGVHIVVFGVHDASRRICGVSLQSLALLQLKDELQRTLYAQINAKVRPQSEHELLKQHLSVEVRRIASESVQELCLVEVRLNAVPVKCKHLHVWHKFFRRDGAATVTHKIA